MNSTIETKINKKVFWKKSLKVLIPIVLSQMLIISVGFVDNFMITGYDEAQHHLTAVGAGAEMWFATSSIYIAVGILFSIFYAQFNAKENKDNFKQTFKINIYFTFIISIFVSILMVVLAPQLMSLFFLSDAPTKASVAKELSITYFRILASANIFASIAFLLLNPLVTIGKTKYLLIVSAVSLITNALFDYIFIYPFDLGAMGASISTAISFFIEMVLAFYFFYKNKSVFKGMGGVFNINKKILKMFLKRSWMILTFSLMSWSLVAMTIVWANMFGSELIKSMSIAYAVSSIMFTIFPAINQSIKIIIGKELGRGNFTLAKHYSKILILPILLITFIISIIGFSFAFILPVLLIKDPEYQDYARWMIIVYSIAIFSFVANSYYTGMLEAGGKQIQVAFLNYFSQIWAVLPIAIICGPYVLDYNFKITFICSQTVMFIVAGISFTIYSRFKWMTNLNNHKDLQ
ncbi:MAG: MATE family efflux transporter [Mycoplasmatales bacterium]|nr:MATE family efflux transporter [Mycoplasmatales bacterium]